MNLNDLVIVSNISSNVDKSKVSETSKHAFVIGFGHINAFLDSYYEYLAITDIDLSLAINMTSNVPQSLLKGRMNIDEFEDSEIIHDPFGIVFQGKNKKGKPTKFLF